LQMKPKRKKDKRKEEKMGQINTFIGLRGSSGACSGSKLGVIGKKSASSGNDDGFGERQSRFWGIL